ncbi:hypothetical protein FCIRC_12561 [Fusarium circinatum]|uniref:CCHC-type domain-containing protein n=1 Tax=Fusarium circinatum TaxID=48490 RepID=A0A8H5SYK2_FUSCI|nr:hypothetical protein FCIRC_12561 [Fusarium circinatum]
MKGKRLFSDSATFEKKKKKTLLRLGCEVFVGSESEALISFGPISPRARHLKPTYWPSQFSSPPREFSSLEFIDYLFHRHAVPPAKPAFAWDQSAPPAEPAPPVAQQLFKIVQDIYGPRGYSVPGLGNPANEPAVAPITQHDNPAPDKYKKALKFQSKAGQSAEPEPTHTFAKVAWTAGQNKLVDDAARRATEACPDKVVIRVLPWKREFANLQRVTDAKPAVTETHSLASNVDLAMADHLDAFRARQFENSHPSCVFASLSQIALVEFARHTDFVPQLIVVDEAARLTEKLSLAPQAEWQSAFCIYIGDTQQFPPIALTVKQRDFKAIFSYQRQTSPFHRIGDAGRILARRSRNYRARVNAASWAQTMFYGGNMSIVHRNHSEASKEFHNWMEEKFKKFGCLSTTVIIRPDNAEELKTGNSYANPANANFAVQLVVQLYRDAALVDAQDFSKRASVLILTPYREQKRLHKADVIILNLVRTVKKSFISEAPRMNVSMTRARLGQFVVGPGKKTPLEWPLNHLVAFLEERSAVINLRDRCRWYLMCQNCCQPGHLATECTFKPKCVRCDTSRISGFHRHKALEQVYVTEREGRALCLRLSETFVA